MRDSLNKIREPVSTTIAKKILFSLLILILGITLGLISKVLDETPSNLLPNYIEKLDLRNFFSRMGFWLFSGICIAIYSRTPKRAAINSFLFFAGMVSSYYLYTVMVAGFFPKSYMMIWVFMTLLSPFFGIVCWYAKGTHMVSICISTIIFVMMTRQAFHFCFWYLNISYVLELILWFATIFILYINPKQIFKVISLGIVFFFLTSQLYLFGGML